jgi:ubiquinone/menaquinone biosynthesis C-methylase UbiE
MRSVVVATALVSTAACHGASQSPTFPPAGRDVAPIVSDAFSTEDARDRVGEFEAVMRHADVRAGMWVADIGAGEGYYTVRLSPLVGAKGRVLAQDIVASTRDQLAQRVQRGGLDNVAVRLGAPADPMLPPASFDRIFMVHMYHEVTDPYAFLWHLVGGLKPGGQVVVVDADRPVSRHGIPPLRLACELAEVGLKQRSLDRLPGTDSYVATFAAASARPAVAGLKPCTAISAE